MLLYHICLSFITAPSLLQILAKKTKKATMHTIWKSWNDEVQEAKREVSSEEQEHINARESMFGFLNSNFLQNRAEYI